MSVKNPLNNEIIVGEVEFYLVENYDLMGDDANNSINQLPLVAK